MKAPSPPKPPDPYKVSAADQQGNTGTAIAQTWMNNSNQFTPWGSITHRQSDTRQVKDAQGNMIDVPVFTSEQIFSPEENAKYQMETDLTLNMGRIAQSQLGRLDEALSQPINTDGLPQEQRLSGNYTDYRNRAEAALRERMSPELERIAAADRTRLANQGVRMGSVAYDRGEDQIARNRHDAELAIIGAGGAESDRALMHDQAIVDSSATARERALQERLLQRNQPLNEIAALTSGSQVNAPQFAPYKPGTIMPTSVGDNIWKEHQAKVANWQTQVQQKQAAMGGMFQLGGNLLRLGLGGWA
jgi:hypothetical protein